MISDNTAEWHMILKFFVVEIQLWAFMGLLLLRQGRIQTCQSGGAFQDGGGGRGGGGPGAAEAPGGVQGKFLGIGGKRC